MVVDPMTAILIGGLGVSAVNLVKDAWKTNLQTGLQEKELASKDKIMQGQLAGMTAANTANIEAAAEYMAMMRADKRSSRKDKNIDRRMQLIMMMMSGLRDYDRQEIEVDAKRNLPAPPMGMMTLLRGR